MATVRDVTYEVLRAGGLTTVFGNPGSNELPFLAGLPDDFRYVLGLHEGAVLAMADGFVQAGGVPALVNLHAAAGTGNAMGVLANAAHAHTPLVLLAGQQVRSMIGQEVFLANVDAQALTRPLVKHAAEPACAQDVPRAVRQAIAVATLPPSGPTYLSVPYDDWEVEAPGSAGHLAGRSTVAAGALPPAVLDDLVALLDGARAPALVLGADVDAQRANADAVRLAEALGAPAWLAPSASRCSFPPRHPAFRGQLPASIAGISDALSGHDVVLVAGAPVFRYHQFVPGPALPEGTRLVHLTCDPGEAARAPVGDAIVCSLPDAIAQLAGTVSAGTRPGFPPRPPIPAPRTAEAGVHPEELFATLRDLAPEDTVWVNESTSTVGAFWAQADLRVPGSYLFPAAGGLGFGLPAAVGAQLALPGRQVVGLIGDGSAHYGITALWTAARYGIPVIIVILANGTYGALRWFADVLGVAKAPGLDVPGIDHVALAGGYGVPASSVSSATELAAAFTAARASGRPALIEVVTPLIAPQ